MQVIGKLADLMSGKIYMQKYVDPSSPIVKIHINNASIENTLIDLGEAINVIKKVPWMNHNCLIFVIHP
jgi:hypothetical protein